MARQSPFMSSAQFTYPQSYQQRDSRYSTNSNVEANMGLNRRPSLLAGYHNHFGSPERSSLAQYYLPLAAPVSMGPHVDEHSKRSRFPTAANISVNSQLMPLSIDIKKEQQVYQPQTEAISPTPDDLNNETNLRDSTIIRNSISKLESEIEVTRKKLQRAKQSQSEIKSQADKSAADDENDDQIDFLRVNGSQTLIERILHENRRKAEDGQKIFVQLNNNIDLNMPIYQEPIDIDSIQQIRTKYLKTMKKHLQEFFKSAHENYKRRMIDESNKYDELYKIWQKSIEKEERSMISKDQTTYREIFEKTFSELRKTREDKEKKQGANETSNVEPQNAVNNGQIETENENEEEKLRKSSIVPPVIFDRWQRKHQYFNDNGLIREKPEEFYKEKTKMPLWSNEEKQIFIEKFTQSPKNFGFISSFLEKKTIENCVQFYYMTKKRENYKNLLRKQTQANKRKNKQNAPNLESSIPKVASFVSQQIPGSTTNSSAQDFERTNFDRNENDDERRETNQTDGTEEKRATKNRCQLLSCTTEKTGKKKNRKNRLRAFPNKWNELTDESRETIRRSLQIPQNVQRCCTRCYEKLIIQVRQQENNNQTMEEDDDDDESSKMPTTIPNDQDLKQSEDWTDHDIDAFTEALHKFGTDWIRIADFVRRSEQSCRAFYMKFRKKTSIADEELNNDDDNGSVSGSEDIARQLTIPTKNVTVETIDEDNEEEGQKIRINDETVESPREMVIDEGDDQLSIVEEKRKENELKPNTVESNLHLTTINSLVEKEISKTLHATDKRMSMNRNLSPDKTRLSPPIVNTNQPPIPSVNLKRPHSPNNKSPLSSKYNLHLSPNQHSFPNKGSIMRGTPIASSVSPSNKPISIDTSTGHPHTRAFPSPRTEYSQHSSSYHESSHLKSSKIGDRNIDTSQFYVQQQQQQQQSPYVRHYPQTQTHKSSPMSSHSSIQHSNKSHPTDSSNTDTFETLRADFVTSRYLTTTHSPNHERSRHPSEQRSPSQNSSISTNSQTLLPPPSAIGPAVTTNPTMQSSNHHPNSQHQQQQQQQQAALLAASQLLASSGMYPQELLASGLLPYSSYYNSIPGSPFFLDPRLMHELAAANSEQMKNLRGLHPTHTSAHSPPDLPSAYQSSTSKRHAIDNIEHMRYSSAEYPPSAWRSQNPPNTQSAQSIHSQMKPNPGNNENPLLKANELARHQTRLTPATEREARSPDDYHHRLSQARAPTENPSIHFTRSDLHSYHKSASHEKLSTSLHFSEHPNDTNSNPYLRGLSHIHKTPPTHHTQHFSPHHISNSSGRPSLVPPSQISPNHLSNYMLHGLHPSTIGAVSPRQQKQPSPHHSQTHYPQHRHNHPSETHRSSKESISIQDYIKQSVHDFVASSNTENKTNTADSSTTDNSNSQSSRVNQTNTHFASKSSDTNDQPILIDGDDDSNPMRESNEMNSMATADSNSRIRSNQDLSKLSTVDGEPPERRRDSSIKKILSNQPLEKQEYVEINQKIQNSNVGASKVHSSSDINGLERSNSGGSRETTRSRGSITMRMLMGANGIYADGKAQPMTVSELTQETANKRSASPNDRSQSLEYLIRGELDRACPTIPKRDDSSSSIFNNRSLSNHSSPTPQQRPPSMQSMSNSKRMRMSPKDDGSSSASESRHGSYDMSTNVRDPFVLQTHSKSAHSNVPPVSTAPGSNPDRTWQSYVQQQYQNPGGAFASRISRTGNVTSGSITQGSPISPSIRSSHDMLQYPPASNNQLMNPRYSYYLNKNETQGAMSGQSYQDHSPKSKFARRSQQAQSSPTDTVQHESISSQNLEQSPNLRSPPNGPALTITTGSTPPTMSSPVSSSVSPTTSATSASAHSLKKRLISEYEHEQLQRGSPTTISPSIPNSTGTPPPATALSTSTTSNNRDLTTSTSDHHIEDISDGEPTVTTSNGDADPST